MGDALTVDAVVFDLDDTLYPERSFATSALREVAERFAAVLGPPPAVHARMCALLDSEDRGRVFDLLLADRGISDTAAQVREMIAVYRAHRPVLSMYPDAASALARLRGRVPLGLITDGPVDLQQGKIDGLGVAQQFAAIVITGRWGQDYYKPHPRAFRETERLLKTTGRRCVYVADNLTKDFVAPRHLGWQTVHIRRPDGLYAGVTVPPGGEPKLTIDSLDALDDALLA